MHFMIEFSFLFHVFIIDFCVSVFQNIRSSLKSKYKYVASDKESDDEGNVDGFIVSDSNVSSDDDDDDDDHFEDCDHTSPQLPTENHLLRYQFHMYHNYFNSFSFVLMFVNLLVMCYMSFLPFSFQVLVPRV